MDGTGRSPGEPAAVMQALTSSGRRPEPGLARQLSDLARSMQAEPDSALLLDHIVHSAVREVPGATHAAITLIQHGHFSSPAATSDLASRIDQAQYKTGEGPCLSACRDHGTILVDDLARERRWPSFTSAAAGMGIASVLSFDLFVRADSLGALNLYAEAPHAFDDEAQSVGLLFASHAAIAMAACRQAADLKTGLTSRDIIGQAKGILMERYKITPAHAFDLLITASQHTNRKLRDVAAELTETGRLSDSVGSA